jgi:predicted dehydrogenase
MTPLRTVIVGLNHYHVTGWVESLAGFPDQIEIVGRFDADPARSDRDAPDFSDPNLSQSFPAWMSAVPFFSDLDALVDSTAPDLALVTLPNVQTPSAIRSLASAGVHLLVDKPGGPGALAAGPARDAVHRSGVKAAVAFTRRYGRPWQQAAATIRSGRLGRLLTVEALFTTSSVFVRDPANHIFNRSLMGGGILSWLGVHDIDLVHWLTGERIDLLQAMTAMTNDAGIDVEDTVSVSFRTTSGALGTMHFAYALPRPGGEGYVALRGSDGSVRIDANGTTTWIGAGSPDDPLLTEQTTFDSIRLPGYGSAGHAIIADLLEAISDDRQPLATLDDAVTALQVIDAVYESAIDGRRVHVGGTDDA